MKADMNNRAATADIARLFHWVLAMTATVVVPGCPAIGLVTDSGITGVILVGPQCPVVGPGIGDECDAQPFMGTVIVQSADGIRGVARFTGDENGAFRVGLMPGQYLLVPLPGPGGFPFANEQAVEVVPGEFTEVDILYDTGIR